REPLITNIMWRNLIVQALYQVVVLLVLNFAGESILPKQDTRAHDFQVKNTLIFNAFVMCQEARNSEVLSVRDRITNGKKGSIVNPYALFASLEGGGREIFNEFNARKPDEMNVFRGVTKNRLFMGIVGVTFILQIIIIEFLGKFASTVRLDWKLWLASFLIGIVSWPLAIAGKLIPVPKTPLSRYFLRPLRRLRRSRSAQ
ncbi:calcium-transporting ATPase plasma membrane-type-like protein, partial [Trifolium pratense]